MSTSMVLIIVSNAKKSDITLTNFNTKFEFVLLYMAVVLSLPDMTNFLNMVENKDHTNDKSTELTIFTLQHHSIDKTKTTVFGNYKIYGIVIKSSPSFSSVNVMNILYT